MVPEVATRTLRKSGQSSTGEQLGRAEEEGHALRDEVAVELGEDLDLLLDIIDLVLSRLEVDDLTERGSNRVGRSGHRQGSDREAAVTSGPLGGSVTDLDGDEVARSLLDSVRDGQATRTAERSVREGLGTSHVLERCWHGSGKRSAPFEDLTERSFACSSSVRR